MQTIRRPALTRIQIRDGVTNKYVASISIFDATAEQVIAAIRAAHVLPEGVDMKGRKPKP